MSGSFFDSNVAIYRFSPEREKRETAKRLIDQGGTISVQVLNEITSVARRKMRMSWEETGEVLTVLRGLLDVRPLTVAVHDRGIALAARHNLNVYDAMIVAAALEADCETLYSEDMQHGLRVAGQLTIINPFV